MRGVDPDVAWHLARHDKVISRTQALGLGLSRHQWQWMLSTGAWQSVTPGVAVGHSGEVSERQLLRAAVLTAGAGARLSGFAGLRFQGLTGGTVKQADVVIPTRCRVVDTTVGGLQVVTHRLDLPPSWTTSRQGLALVKPHGALLHHAAWADTDREAEWPVAAAVQQKVTAVVLLRKGLADLKRHPRRALLGVVLDDVEHGAHAGTELAFLRFCRAHGLPEPDALQVKVRANGTRYLDARYDRQRVTVELDGAHHREARQWDADALRGLEVVAGTGDRLVRITGGNLRHDGDAVATALRLLLLDEPVAA